MNTQRRRTASFRPTIDRLESRDVPSSFGRLAAHRIAMRSAMIQHLAARLAPGAGGISNFNQTATLNDGEVVMGRATAQPGTVASFLVPGSTNPTFHFGPNTLNYGSTTLGNGAVVAAR